MARIEMDGLVKRYGHDTVVDGVDLRIDDGELVVLLGPSGCGKTTTLRMVAGLEQITAGELRFDGALVNHEPPHRRSVGMVFQNYALYPHMTVRANLLFGLQSRRRSGSRRSARAEERRLVQEIAKLLELEHVMDHRPKELSGGQRQRVALGRALVRRPQVFLLDEPLSNLDANLRERMRMELSRLHEQLPITTVYVTHDQSEALTLADRVVVMQEGKVRQVASPREIYDAPADAFVAGFIGSPGMNLWTLPWNEDDQGEVALGEEIRLPRRPSPALYRDGQPITVGIRPEHLEVAGHPDLSSVFLSCQVDVVEDLGSHVLVHGTVGSDGARRVVAKLDPTTAVQRGARLRFRADPDRVHAFDALTGARLGTFTGAARIAVSA